MGFAQHKTPVYGFSAYREKPQARIAAPRLSRPLTGFATLMKNAGYVENEDGWVKSDEIAGASGVKDASTKPVPRAKRHRPASEKVVREQYPFPPVAIGRTIVQRTVTAEWRRFHDALSGRAGAIGKVIAPEALTCELIPAAWIGDALTERYSRLAQNPSKERARKDKSHEVAQFAAGHIHGGITAQRKQTKSMLDEYEKRAVGIGLTIEEYEAGRQAVLDKEQDYLWTPRTFAIDYRSDAIGPMMLGAVLEDDVDVLARESRSLADALCREFDLNPAHFRHPQLPSIGMVDTAPAPVAGLQIALPPMPADITLGVPRAY